MALTDVSCTIATLFLFKKWLIKVLHSSANTGEKRYETKAIKKNNVSESFVDLPLAVDLLEVMHTHRHTHAHSLSLFDEAGSEKGVPRELEAAEIQTR